MAKVVDRATPQLRRLAGKRLGSTHRMLLLGRRIVRTIKLHTPVDTGALRRSADIDAAGPDSVTVGYTDLLPRGPRRPNLPQATAIEFGTSRMRAFRAIRRALSRHRLDIEQTYADAIQEDLNRLPNG